jgi:transposase
MQTGTPPQLDELLEANQKLSHKVEYLEERIQFLMAKLYGKSSEKYPLPPADQLSFLEAQLEELQREVKAVEVPAHQRQGSGRKPLPAELPRVEVLHDLPESEKTCACGAELSKIGEESSEQLEFLPPRLRVIVNRRPKYACRSCEGVEDEGPTVKIAPAPKFILPKSIASAGLLAQIVTAKFVDSLPFYRQEKQFKRLGYEISRTLMANWCIQVAERLERLLYLLHQEIKLRPLIHIDETTLQVLKEAGRKATSKSYLWALRSGASKHPLVYFTYDPSRSGKIAEGLLEGYEGLVLSDGYAGYNFIEPSRHGHCWAHARRKFAEALQIKKTSSACEMLELIKGLYRIEGELAEVTWEERYQARQERSQPVIEKIHQWLSEKQSKVAPKTKLGEAINYSLSLWPGLTLFLERPELPLDNNAVENAIRPVALGRKNWLFSDTPAGAHATAALYSLVESAKACDLNPVTYLQTLFERFPYAQTDEQIKALLPCYIDLSKTN